MKVDRVSFLQIHNSLHSDYDGLFYESTQTMKRIA